MRIGIPDFKMEKHLIDRRMAQMQSEGVEFKSNREIGKSIIISDLINQFDAITVALVQVPRDLDIPGRDLNGVHYAMEFLSQQNDRISVGKEIDSQSRDKCKK